MCIGAFCPLRRQNGPAFMVAPAAVDLEVTRRVALLVKPTGCSQPDGRLIARLDVGFKPVELECLERVANDSLQALPHVALPLKAGKGVVAKITTLERPVHNI